MLGANGRQSPNEVQGENSGRIASYNLYLYKCRGRCDMCVTFAQTYETHTASLLRLLPTPKNMQRQN